MKLYTGEEEKRARYNVIFIGGFLILIIIGWGIYWGFKYFSFLRTSAPAETQLPVPPPKILSPEEKERIAKLKELEEARERVEEWIKKSQDLTSPAKENRQKEILNQLAEIEKERIKTGKKFSPDQGEIQSQLEEIDFLRQASQKE